MSKYGDVIKKIFDIQREGKGVEKGPKIPQNFVGFFKYFKLHFNDIFKVNILLIIGNFPILFAVFAMTGNLNSVSSAPTSALFAQLRGAMLHEADVTPALMALLGVHGVQGELSVMTTATVIMFCLSALIIFTMGPVMCGATYLLRNLLKGEPLFFFSDLKYAIKRNIKQALPLGIIDCAITALLFYNITLAYFNVGSYITGFVFYANIALMVLYLIMRPYLYIMLVTFDLSLFKIFKNALIFAVIGAKRNVPALIGAGAVVVLNYALIMVFPPLGICMPLFITLGAVWYIFVYAAFDKIKQVMIDPYYKNEDSYPEETTLEDLS